MFYTRAKSNDKNTLNKQKFKEITIFQYFLLMLRMVARSKILFLCVLRFINCEYQFENIDFLKKNPTDYKFASTQAMRISSSKGRNGKQRKFQKASKMTKNLL